MNVYMYQSELFCGDCGEVIRKELREHGYIPCDFEESSFDSDEYPKGPIPDGGGEADCPRHCGSGAECVKAFYLIGDQENIGAWLENPLTKEGFEYVKEAIEEGREIALMWKKYYSLIVGPLPAEGNPTEDEFDDFDDLDEFDDLHDFDDFDSFDDLDEFDDSEDFEDFDDDRY